MSSAIDHLVIAAETLEQGADYVKQKLGVDIPFGGVHPRMGTHNLLMGLGNTQFLEVIAINPGAAAPTTPRWFGLDDPHLRQRLKSGPVFLSWVANTHNIKELMRGTEFPFGRPEQISRGDLSWYFGLPEDGRLLASGLLPYLIEWQTDRHPAGAMRDNACRLVSLTLHHANAAWIESILDSIHLTHQIKVKSLAENATPYMVAMIDSPAGIKELSSIAL